MEVNGPALRSMKRSAMVQRAHGRPQTNPSGALLTSHLGFSLASVASSLYSSLIEQVKSHPDRVTDPQLTQYLPDACSLLLTTDLHLRETILHVRQQ